MLKKQGYLSHDTFFRDSFIRQNFFFFWGGGKSVSKNNYKFQLKLFISFEVKTELVRQTFKKFSGEIFSRI